MNFQTLMQNFSEHQQLHSSRLHPFWRMGITDFKITLFILIDIFSIRKQKKTDNNIKKKEKNVQKTFM